MKRPLESREVDIRGMVCPGSLMAALKAINAAQEQIREGSLELLLLTDNPDATVTIPNAAHAMGYAVEVSVDRDFWRVTVSASREWE